MQADETQREQQTNMSVLYTYKIMHSMLKRQHEKVINKNERA